MSISDDPVDNVLSRLRGVRKQGSGWMAKCPAHDDDKQSLKVDRGRDGCAVLICFAGCDTQRIVGAIDLGMTDLFPPKSEQPSPRPAQRKAPMPAFASAPAPTAKKELAVYKYKDEQGEVLYEAIRYDPKDFKQRVPLPNGDYEWKLNGTRRVLYKLPELITSSANLPVYIPEGEKDVLALLKRGLVATCNVGGAGKWHDEYSLFLKGRDVVVLPDNDESGRKHARQVAESVKPYARSVKVLSLPGIPEKGDVSDWLKAGGTVEELERLAGECQEFTGNEPEPSAYPILSIGHYFSLPEEHIEYLVEDMLTVGGVSAIGAKPKVGKSTLSRNLVVNVAQGKDFLGRGVKKGNVLYWALEEQRPIVLDHLRRLGARATDPIFLHVGAHNFPNPVEALGAQIREHNAVLAVVDPLPRFIKVDQRRGGRDMQAVYDAWQPIVELARSTGCHICFLMHARKSVVGEDPFETGLDMLMDSIGNAANIDTGLLMVIKSGERVAWTVQRSGPNMEQTVLKLDEDTGIIKVGGMLDEYRLLGLQRIILQFLDAHPEGALVEEIVAETKARKKDVTDSLSMLRMGDEPLVVRDGLGKPRHPYTYFRAGNENGNRY